MNESVYAVDARLQAAHWWYVGRRRLFAGLIRDLGLQRNDHVLDVGTSAGTNLRLLRELGFESVTGLDLSPDAIRFCAENGYGTVRRGDVTDMPFRAETFSLVLATDIIEHVDDDRRALQEIRRVLKPGHAALITVPAFPELWGFQDVVSKHKRRYRMRALREHIRDAGLVPERAFHFNYLLFAPIFLARQLMKLRSPSVQSESEINTPLINRVLSRIFHFDVMTAERFRPPFGVSILILVRRPAK
jgi:SAM-dependent methyltransferase